MKESDSTLVKLTLDGNDSAYHSLIEKYKAYLFVIILKRINDKHQTEDLVQETFISAYLNLSNLKSPSKFKSWIATIATNICKMWLRENDINGKNIKLEVDKEINNSQYNSIDSPEKIIDKMVFEKETEKLLEVLSDKARKAILLHYDQGLSYKQIADITDVSISTVRSRLQHGRSKLKRELIGMGKRSKNNYDLPKDFSKNVLKEAIDRGEELQWDFNVFKHNLNTRDLLADSWHARIDGKDFLVKKAKTKKDFMTEKKIFKILGEENFPVPKLYHSFDDDLIFTMEWHGERNLLEIIHSGDSDEKTKYLSKAFQYFGELEGIYIKRIEEFNKLSSHLCDDIPPEEELNKGINIHTENIIENCIKLGVLRDERDNIAILKNLLVDIVLKAFSFFSFERIPGINFIYPFNLVIFKEEVIFTGIFSFVIHLGLENRLFTFSSQPTISRGARYDIRLNDYLLDKFLDGYSKYSSKYDKNSLSRNLDLFHVFRFSEGLGNLFDQMENIKNNWKYVELAETYGSYKQRANDMISSYLDSPSFSDDELVSHLRYILKKVRV